MRMPHGHKEGRECGDKTHSTPHSSEKGESGEFRRFSAAGNPAGRRELSRCVERGSPDKAREAIVRSVRRMYITTLWNHTFAQKAKKSGNIGSPENKHLPGRFCWRVFVP